MTDSEHLLKEVAAGAFLIWDAEGIPDAGAKRTVLWRSFGAGGEDAGGPISIPRLVEAHADELRSQYLAWVYALGNARVQGKSVVEHLLIRPQLSFWWLGSLAQKFNLSATSLVSDAIKLLALEKLVSVHTPPAISLVSNNKQLAACIEQFCRASNRDFEWSLARDEDAGSATGKLAPRHRLPGLIRAVGWFGHFLLRGLSLLLREQPQPGVADVAFFDVLVHLDKRALKTGRFVSNYWTTLVEKLDNSRLRTNWFHVYYRQPAIRSALEADRLLQRFNESAGGQQVHSLVDVRPTIGVMLGAWRDYFRLRQAARHLAGFHQGIHPPGSVVNLWPLHSQEWTESLCGSLALSECIRLALFEHQLKRVPHQRTGIYICENQAWEMALISAWRQAGHGRLVGVPHTTVRFWDLRYFYDSRSYKESANASLPMPDMWAVNGPVAKATMLSAGYPAERLLEVEALRFLHLSATKKSDDRTGEALRILICGDFLKKTTDKMFRTIAAMSRSAGIDAKYIFKPHPAFPYNPDPEHVSQLKLLISEETLSTLLQQVDVVLTSPPTSASVDAYCSGLQVIQLMDGDQLDTSPLRGVPGVIQVGSDFELANALRSCLDKKDDLPDPYFLLDKDLEGWRSLFGFTSDGANWQQRLT
jgi:surface carbohydrate biosynthesis protein (TIGR04326 family)